MTINEVHLITFSPTHTSRQIGEAIMRGLDIKEVVIEDLTKPCDVRKELPADALAIITVPVYGGHVAPLALQRMKEIRANHEVWAFKSLQEGLLSASTRIATMLIP